MILIIGSGRTATHFAAYFSLLKIDFLVWNRRQKSLVDLEKLLLRCSRVLVLISDSELESFISGLRPIFGGQIFHMSGALEIPGATSLHPLMTFGPEIYDIEVYKKIPFILVEKKKLQNYFPELPNISYEVSPESKGRYHALCVASGNFTTLLWLEAFSSFESLGLPREIAFPFLQKTTENLMATSGSQALTGPLARKDSVTVAKNLDSLRGHRLHDIYRSFVRTYFPESSV